MSFARGDLARRTALADNLAVPEPWSSNDSPRVFAAIRDLKDEFRRLGITDADGKGRLPDFLLDYEHLPPIKPAALDRAHARNSSATRWDQNGNLVEEPSDTLRLQRDPKTQEPLGLLYEPQRTQQFAANPTDFTSGWGTRNLSVSKDTGSAKGLQFDTLVETNDSTTERHDVRNDPGLAEGKVFSLSAIVRANGRDFAKLIADLQQNNIFDESSSFFFDLANGVVGEGGTYSGANVIEQSIQDLGESWYRCKVVINPDSSHSIGPSGVGLADDDGSLQYAGDGRDALDILHAQAEVSREVTTPILTGNATRGADEVDYRFDFPDRTTGVAYSIEQQYGDNVLFGGPIRFGDIGSANDRGHGVLNHFNGLNGDDTDGFKTKTRNSNQDSEQGRSIIGDKVDRFLVSPTGSNLAGSTLPNLPLFTVRQVAIHTQPHTQAQKDTLRDQYLTQP